MLPKGFTWARPRSTAAGQLSNCFGVKPRQFTNKKEGGSDVRLLLRSFGRLLNCLAERGAGDGRGTRYVSADHAALVCEKPTLAGDAARQRLGCKRVSGNDVIDYATCPVECVTALLCRVLGEHGINQVRSRRGGRTGWTQICKVEGISSVGRRIGDW